MLRDYRLVIDRWFGTQSLEHAALRIAVGKNGTLYYERVWCVGRGVHVFVLEISENV
jgi:hypothetical protein